MRLVIKSNENLQSLFPREPEPAYTEDRAEPYDSKKLQEWEQRYKEIQILLDKEDNQEGMRVLFDLAEEGYPEARWQMSDMYLEGKGLPMSLRKAHEWERKAIHAEKLYCNK